MEIFKLLKYLKLSCLLYFHLKTPKTSSDVCFVGVQREISTGALPWAERRDVVMIADGNSGDAKKNKTASWWSKSNS